MQNGVLVQRVCAGERGGLWSHVRCGVHVFGI